MVLLVDSVHESRQKYYTITKAEIIAFEGIYADMKLDRNYLPRTCGMATRWWYYQIAVELMEPHVPHDGGSDAAPTGSTPKTLAQRRSLKGRLGNRKTTTGSRTCK